MKKCLSLLLLSCLAVSANGATKGTNLFSDSYDRTNNVDVDIDSTGMSGLLLPAIYEEAFEGSGSATSIQVLDNQLNIAVGAGMSSFFIDHNLIDSEILASDGFSVSLDVVSITAADDQGNRFGGFGVGCTRDEALAANDTAQPNPLRPNTGLSGANAGVADFYVDLALDNNVHIWKNGLLVNAVNVGVNSGNIRADFLVDDFNAGTTVIAAVYFNDELIDSQTFTWDNTDINYVALSGRTAGAGVFVDNLEITTAFNDKANTPSPIDGDTLVTAAGLNLSWNIGKGSDGTANPDITGHYLYIAEDEPNFIDISPVLVSDITNPITTSAYTFVNDKKYYWRVDESLGNSGPTDPNLIAGDVWSFDTFTYPVVTVEPTTAIASDGVAQLTCTFSSMTEPAVIWYIENGDNDIVIDLSGENTEVTSPLDTISYQSVLTVHNIALADEAQLYCKISNSAGTTDSALADLRVERLVGYWKLDEITGGDINLSLVDSSVSTNDLQPAFTTETTTYSFTTGVDGTTNGALVFDGVFALGTLSEDGLMSDIPVADETFTIAAWIKPTASDNRGIVGWGNYPTPMQVNGFRVTGDSTLNNFWWSSDLDGQTPISMLDDSWHLAAVTYDGTTRTIYFDGIQIVSDEPETHAVPSSINFYLGKNNPTVVQSFAGAMDEVKVYNYSLTNTEIAELYVDVMGGSLCIEPVQYDMNNDCILDVYDLAMFAGKWLDCGIYSTCIE